MDNVKSAIISYLDKHSETPHSKVWEYIVAAAREPLGIIATPLRSYFLAKNITISFLGSTRISEMPSIPTIGRENAYQIPA